MPQPTKTHFSITQASVTAGFVWIVGQAVAFVPSISNDQQILVSAGSAVIAAIFLVANAVHKLADSNVSATDVKAGAIDAAQAAAQAELGKVDLNALAQNAVQGRVPTPAQIEQLVERSLQDKLTALLGARTTVVPSTPEVPQ